MNIEKSKTCVAEDIALKSFFLGPQAENAELLKELIDTFFSHWVGWRKSLYPEDGCAISQSDQQSAAFQQNTARLRSKLQEVLSRYEAEVPKFSPRYVGHMFSEISIPALLGQIISLAHNPNNICSDTSRVGLQLEKEAIEDLAKMLGMNTDLARGHFCSGGTLANFEALHRARHRLDLWLSMSALAVSRKSHLWSLFESAHVGWKTYSEYLKQKLSVNESSYFSMISSNPFEVSERLQKIFQTPYRGPVVLVPQNKHYSWTKGVPLIGLSEEALWPIELDQRGKLCLTDLKRKINKAREKSRPILMVVSVAGTTELGEVDPIHEVSDLLDHFREKQNIHIWHHVDAAYGGFFCSLGDLLDESLKKPLGAIRRCNSVTLDPHKLGYVPYSCGAFLCADEKEYEVKRTHAPYVFSTACADPGMFTIEGSRSASGPTATWLSSKTIGFNSEGYGRILKRSIDSKKMTESIFAKQPDFFRVAPYTDTNVACFTLAHPREPLSKANERAENLMQKVQKEKQFYISKTILDKSSYAAYMSDFVASWGGQMDVDWMFLIRLCLMNPFYLNRETKTFYPEVFFKHLQSLSARS